jgi:hypothetical protein
MMRMAASLSAGAPSRVSAVSPVLIDTPIISPDLVDPAVLDPLRHADPRSRATKSSLDNRLPLADGSRLAFETEGERDVSLAVRPRATRATPAFPFNRRRRDS